MAHQHLKSVQLFCLLGAISTMPRVGALLCYEATSSLFRAVTLHNWKWLLLRSMVWTRRGVVGFKGCSPIPSYPQRVSYLVSPPGVSIASYSRVCRTYLCNNLTSLDPFVKLKAYYAPQTIEYSSQSCPTCVGGHSTDCLPNFVTTDPCPYHAPKCYSSTLKFQAGFLNTTFLLMGCAAEQNNILTQFQNIGSMRVTEVINILEKAQIGGAQSSSWGPAWAVVLGILLAFRH
ncbi:ly6/PLAUR domain-containing protein 4 isoform X2 [Talpa occidentalis]|uniref:ly6/PLAUR domain-containing protein 4 isoform X2 n=1 Tax=Talpa occidentalis TaxID=50954 RepID=UPI00188EA6C7|nr:ly6/PLAUR domain-containing protein 4 isoform X2 [Talpa occidentalis]